MARLDLLRKAGSVWPRQMEDNVCSQTRIDGSMKDGKNRSSGL